MDLVRVQRALAMIQRVINWQLNLRISQNMDFQLRALPIISTLLLKLCQISESMAKENLKKWKK